jgi:hypothetical protein
MLAQIHAGERIIPAADNRALMSALNQGDQGGLAAELRALRADNERLSRDLQSLLAQIASTSRDTVARLNQPLIVEQEEP